MRIGQKNYGYINVKVKGKSKPLKVSMFTAAFGPTLDPSTYSSTPSSEKSQQACSSSGPSNSNLDSSPSYTDTRLLSDEWRNMEPKLIDIAMLSFKPAAKICSVCQCSCEEILCCEDCSIPTFFCESCWMITHKFSCFHVRVKWLEVNENRNIAKLINSVSSNQSEEHFNESDRIVLNEINQTMKHLKK